MNLDMFRPKNETECLLFSFTKNCETLIEQTHLKREATLEFKRTQARETFSFDPPVRIERY